MIIISSLSIYPDGHPIGILFLQPLLPSNWGHPKLERGFLISYVSYGTSIILDLIVFVITLMLTLTALLVNSV